MAGGDTMNKAMCYISYCWDDEEYDDFLKKVKQDIEQKSNSKITVILDKISFQASDNFKEKERLILSADCVVPFFSPSFNRAIINEDTHRGVVREYGYIVQKFKVSNETVIPILLKGEKEFAIPSDFKDIIFIDIRSIKFETKKRISILSNSRHKYNDFIEKIVARTNNVHNKAEYQFEDKQEKYDVLLKNTSADGKLLKKCMIKMHAYDEIINQRSYFIIGRKGSGKSTFLEILGKLDVDKIERHYKALRPIYIEYIDINSIYHTINSTRIDNIVFPITDVSDMFWQILFILQGMFIVSTDVELYVIDDSRRKIFLSVSNELKKLLGLDRNEPIDQLTVLKNIPTLALELIQSYITDYLVDNSNYDTLLTSTKVNFNAINILERHFNNGLLKRYIMAVRQCTKKILISLDGFDTYSEDFRRNAYSKRELDYSEYHNRIEFESTFYRSLIKMVTEFKKSPYGNILDGICEQTDFCIVLPQDRWDQIRQIDRDISKKKYCCLFWNAIDLLKMLLFRLENYYEVESDADFHERWCSILSSHIQGITPVLKVRIGGRDVDFDLINYILRLSFWRPRDILLHFIGLLELYDESKKNRFEIDDEAIKDSLNRSTQKIINEEFIAEYQVIFYNIKEVLKEFSKDDLIVSYADFCAKLNKIRFDTSFAYDNNLLENKLSILYQLGVIGLYYEDKAWAIKKYGYHICFYFKDGYGPMADLMEDRILSEESTNIIFNPIFAKHLNMNYNTNEAICNYTWDEIRKIRIRSI